MVYVGTAIAHGDNALAASSHYFYALFAFDAALNYSVAARADATTPPSGALAGAGVRSVVAGRSHACALLGDGRVKCWGGNARGQLGLGDNINRGSAPGDMAILPFVNLGSGKRAVQLAAGAAHTCAVLDDGTAKCWGANLNGELGQGHARDIGDGPDEMGDHLAPIDLGTTTGGTLQIVAGDGHTCALLGIGSVKCFGTNDTGQLGRGDTTARGTASSDMGDNLAAVPLEYSNAPITATALAAGDRHTCAVLQNRQVACWGDNAQGQLGIESAVARGDDAGELGHDTKILILQFAANTAEQITAGSSHTCAILADSRVICWGANDKGQIGIGLTAAAVGDEANEMAQLAHPNFDLNAESYAYRIAAGGSTTCVIASSNGVRCWGANEHGQLGVGDTRDRGRSSSDMGFSLPAVDLNQPIQIAVGGNFACATLSDATVRCWGAGAAGALGTDGTADVGNTANIGGLAAVPLPNGNFVRQLTGGEEHVCALLGDSRVKCWGRGDNFALGLGDGADRGNDDGEMGADLPAVSLGTMFVPVRVVAGGLHTCAIGLSGQLKCWGHNISGSLGNGDGLDRGDTPGSMASLPAVNVGTDVFVRDVGLGLYVTCAYLSGSKIKCWGLGSTGVPATDNGASRGENADPMGNTLIPVDLGTTIQGPRGLAVGTYRACATIQPFGAKCWGNNSNGGFGVGDTTNRGSPSNTMGESLPYIGSPAVFEFTSLTVGRDHTCGRTVDGRLRCWGSDMSGQLGVNDSDAARGDDAGEMASLPFALAGERILRVSAFQDRTCAILLDRSLKCWGANNFGSLGLGNIMGSYGPAGTIGTLPTVDLGSGKRVLDVGGGFNYTCALLTDGTVKCWGNNGFGQLGCGALCTSFGDGPNEMGDALPSVSLF